EDHEDDRSLRRPGALRAAGAASRRRRARRARPARRRNRPAGRLPARVTDGRVRAHARPARADGHRRPGPGAGRPAAAGVPPRAVEQAGPASPRERREDPPRGSAAMSHALLTAAHGLGALLLGVALVGSWLAGERARHAKTAGAVARAAA